MTKENEQINRAKYCTNCGIAYYKHCDLCEICNGYALFLE